MKKITTQSGANRSLSVLHGLRSGHTGAQAARSNMTRALSQAADDGIDLRKLAMRQLLPLALGVGLIWLMWDKFLALDLAYVRSSLGTVGLAQWVGAAVLSAISFWALGRYDLVVHRLIGTKTPPQEAQRAGITAIALSQTVGMGVISSAFVRWRMLPDLSFLQAMRLSVVVSVSFLSAWAVIAAAISLSVPVFSPWATWGAWAVLVCAGVFVLLSVVRPASLQRLNIPPLRAMVAFLFLALIDTAMAGGALWMVMPAECDIALLPLVSAYLVALGAGLVSGTPGGMGAFEITLLAILPGLGQEPLLAAILAYRTVYYAVPALLAALVTMRGPRRRTKVEQRSGVAIEALSCAPHLPVHLENIIQNAPRAESALMRQGRLSVIELADKTPAAMGATSGQSLIVLSDPFGTISAVETLLTNVKKLANQTYLAPFLYKIGGRTASVARKMGWNVLPVAREGWIDPTVFSLDGSAKRQLRRKLRRAQKAQVTVSAATSSLPIADMQRLSLEWSSLRDCERGFSMGTWQPQSMQYARVYLAHQNGDLIGFLTLHANENEQVLDLMRLAQGAPDGTMHAMLTHAINAAAHANCHRLSLAAIPLGDQSREPLLFRHARRAVDKACGAEGLRQFKTSFAPNWETLYAAAPTRAALAFGAIDVAREIGRKSA